VSSVGAGFGTDTNIVTIYERDLRKIELPIMSKYEVAKRLLDKVQVLLKGAE
jgi:phosphopantothenoylcysteine decarboxylase/phosphopantothenate--cysteine ligase